MSLTSVEFEKKKASPNNFSQTFFISIQTHINHAQIHSHTQIHRTEREWVGWLQLLNTMTTWMTALQKPDRNRRHWTLMGEKTKRMKDKGSGTYWKQNISWKRTWGSNITTWNWHQEVINEMLVSIRCQSKQSLSYMYSTMPLHNKWVTESISARCIHVFLF